MAVRTRPGASAISAEGHDERLSDVAKAKKSAGTPGPARHPSGAGGTNGRSSNGSGNGRSDSGGSKGARKSSRRGKASAEGKATRGSGASKTRSGGSKTTRKEDTAKTPTGKAKAKQAAKRAAGKTVEVVGEATDTVKGGGSSSMPKPNKLARKLAAKVAKKAAAKMAESAAERVRTVVDKAAETGHVVVEKTAQQRLPIQVGVDVAVPLPVAWEEWVALECLPEGVHNITEIERDGDVLVGQTDTRRAKDWEAEIVDEREYESFAWRSYEGSDCAGLATFHEISERLTRIELDLDVVPTSVPDTFELALHLADRHAEAYLRRFKARLEFINPDEYEDEVQAYWAERRNGHEANGSSPNGSEASGKGKAKSKAKAKGRNGQDEDLDPEEQEEAAEA